jgi:hypothetical protein
MEVFPMRSPSRFDMTLYDANGKECRGYVLQNWIDATSMDGEAYIPGPKEAFLSDGTPLNRVDANTFQTVSEHPKTFSLIRP